MQSYSEAKNDLLNPFCIPLAKQVYYYYYYFFIPHIYTKPMMASILMTMMQRMMVFMFAGCINICKIFCYTYVLSYCCYNIPEYVINCISVFTHAQGYLIQSFYLNEFTNCYMNKQFLVWDHILSKAMKIRIADQTHPDDNTTV